MEEKKKQKYGCLALLSLILLGIGIMVTYLVNREIPFMMDDLWYATMLSDETPIASLSDIVKAQIWHYNNWGGRSLTHGLLQLILLAGENAADVLNTLAVVVLAILICLVAGVFSKGTVSSCDTASGETDSSTKKAAHNIGGEGFPHHMAHGEVGMEGRTGHLAHALGFLAIAFGMLFGLNANWKMSMFWEAGAANYLYITSFLLLYAYVYLRALPETKADTGVAQMQKASADCDAGTCQVSTLGAGSQERGHHTGVLRSILAAILMLPLGLIAGWSNENMGPSLFVMSLVVILLRLKERQGVRLWMILGSASCLIGSAICILAPGNFVRSAQAGEESYGTLWRVFLRCYYESKAALEYLFPTLLLTVLVLLIAKGILGLTIGRANLLLLFTALLSWGAMILSPHYPDRATFGTMVLLICVILSMAGKIIAVRRDTAWMLWGVGVLVWLRGMYFLGEFLAICWGWIR